MPIRYRLVFLLLSYFFVYVGAKADCPAPQYGYTNNVTYQSAYLSWSYYYNNNSPTYQLQWRAAGAATWVVTSTQTSTGYSLTGLTNNTNYEWRVRTICAAGDTSAFSPTLAFQTKCFPPSYLTTTTVGAQAVRLAWNAYYGGTASEVQWRPAGAATWTVVSNITTGYLTLNGLSSDTYFEWKVRTICSPGATSDFVDGPLFQTQCPVPTNLQTTLSNPDAVELKWNSLLTGVRFDLQWRPAGASAWTLVENLSSPEYVLTGLTNESTYEWQVRTVCTATSRSDFSEIQTIRTRCPVPTALTTNSVSYNSATLQWTSPVPVTVQWRPAGSANWTTVTEVRSPYLLTGLGNNTVYEWRVQASCSSSNASVYTAVQAFTTRCVLPVNLTVYSSGSDGLQFSWNGSVAGEFDLQYRPIGTTDWSVRSGIGSTNFTVTGLVTGVQYEWRVRRVCAPAETSDFATGPLGSPVCSAPSNIWEENTSSSGVDLVWSAEPSAQYELQWRLASAANWTTVSNLTTGRYTLTSLSPNVSYVWQVRRICSGTAASTFSYARSFVLSCQQPYWFYVTNQRGLSATLNWSGSTSQRYDLQYRPSGNPDWTTVSSLIATQYTLTNPTVNTTYEWRVRSVCATDFSTVQTFQVQCGQPVSFISITNVGVSSADLRWYTEGNTNLYEIQYRDITSPDWIVLRPEGTETDRSFGSQNTNTQKGYSLYGLVAGKTYEWRFRTICSPSIYSEFISGGRFTTGCFAPSLANVNQLSNTALVINWYAPSLTTNFELQWRLVGAATWNTVGGLTNGPYTLNELTPGASYEYRVRQQCTPGVWSNFSTTATASLLCLSPNNPSASVLSATSVRVSWSYSTDNAVGADSRLHELQYRPVGATDWTTISGITGTAYSLTGLTSGTSYQYRMRAVCQPGVLSDYSYIGSITLACPGPPSFNVQTESTTALFSSYYESTTQSYVLQWRVLGTSVWSAVSFVGTSYSLMGLTNNTTYEWQVAADCGNGYLSDFTSVQTFQTNCPPVPYLYVSNVGATKAQVSWNTSNRSFGGTYSVQYRISGSVVWTTISGLTSPALSLTGLVANVTYEVRAQAVCGPGLSAGFTGISTFQTQCSGISGANASAVTTQSAQLTWSNNVDNSPVDLQWREATSASAWNQVNGLTSAPYSLTGLKPQTTYEFRIQTLCGTGGTVPPAYSDTFQTASLASYLYVLVDSVAAQQARVRWPTDIQGKTFVLQWRDRASGNWTTSGPLTSRVYLLTDLTPNRTYDVRVGYVDTDNSVVYGISTSFTTSCPQVTSTVTYTITSTSALLSWTGSKSPVTVQWRVGGVSSWNSVTGVVGGNYALAGLSDNTIYEWRLLIPCSADIVTTTSPVAFRTICQMPRTTATQNVGSTSAQLTWSGTGPAYSVQYRAVGAATWTTISSVTTTSYTLTGLTNNTAYEWAVATLCDNTSTTFTSSVRFTTQCSLPTNLGVNPNYADRAQLVWSGTESSYQLQWRAQGSANWNTQSGITSPYLLTGLSTGINYEWRLRSACAVATDGPFVTGYAFSVACPTAYSYNLTVASVTSSTARLTWTVASPGTAYALRYRPAGAVAWTVVAGEVVSPYTLTGLVNNTAYEWQVRSNCQADFVASATFQTSCGAPGNPRTETITATSAQLRWSDSGESVAYEVQWRVAGASAWNRIANVTATGYLLTGLTTNTAYEWQVRSQCPGEASFRLTTSFKTGDACAQGISTLRAGSWDDATIWSCGRLPTLTDPVQLNHALTIPDGYTARAATVRYQTGVSLLFGVGAVLRMGQ